MNKIYLFLAVIWFHSVFLTAFAQTGEYTIKAVAMEQLSRFIEWPSDVWANDASEPFVLAVIGENPFGTTLEDIYSNYKIKNRTVKVIFIKDIEELGSCNILFVSQSEKRNLQEIIDHLKGSSILTIGDTEGYAQSGILANFYIENNKIRFEINETEMKDAGLNVSFLLIKIAKIVNSQKDK